MDLSNASDFVTKTIASIVAKGHYIKPTGSRVTTNFTKYSDYDFVVYDPEERLSEFFMSDTRFELGGSINRESNFASYKSKEAVPINLILVKDKEYFNRYVCATELIKAVNPPDKEGRIKLFDTVFGNKVEVLPF